MGINWLYVGLPAFLVYAAIFGYCLSKRRWTRAALVVGAANMLYVVLNLVAPFRGVLDPNYAGYNMGLLEIQPGFGVTLVAGAIVVLALTSACVAVLNMGGRALLLVAAVDTLLLILIALPETIAVFADLSSYRIELGEYLQIPGLLAGLIVVVVLALPLAYAVLWSIRRIQAESRENVNTGAGQAAA